MLRNAILLALTSTAAAVHAAPLLDGTRDAWYGGALALQTVETGFGDNDSELNAAYARIDSGTLHLVLTGNLESNFNKLNIFIDSRPGGENVLTNSTDFGGNNPTNDGWAVKHAGMTFDAGFTADYMLIFRSGVFGTPRFEVDFAVVGDGTGTVFASTNVFGDSLEGANAAALANGIGVAFDNSNVAGILGGNNAADQAAAAAVMTGIELFIPLAAIGNPLDTIRISAMINGSNHDYLSNQFLGGLPAGTGNLGGDGSGGFNGTVGQINLNNWAGNQYFEVAVPRPVPAPAPLILLGAGLLALLLRRSHPARAAKMQH